MIRIYAEGHNITGRRIFVSRIVEEKDYTIEERVKILFEDFPNINTYYIDRIWTVKDPLKDLINT